MVDVELLFNIDSTDPLEKERAVCMLKNCDIRKLVNVMKECKKRVESKVYTAETCHQEMCDLMEAIDHCVGSKGFAKLE